MKTSAMNNDILNIISLLGQTSAFKTKAKAGGAQIGWEEVVRRI